MDDALRDVHSAACNYDLSGLDPGGVCPECGMAVARSRRSSVPAVLPKDTACLGCGYDLAGLQPTGQCPECAKPIEETLTFRLAAQPLSVLNRLQAAPIWIFSGLGAQIVLGFASSALVMIGISVWQQSRWGALALAVVGAVLTIAIQAASFIGYWKLSTPLAGPEPPGWKHRRFRITLRVSSVLVLLFGVLATPLGLLGMFVLGAVAASPNPSGLGGSGLLLLVLNIGVSVIAGLAQLVRYLASAACVHGLAARIPDAATARRALRIYRWTTGVIIAAVVIACIAGVATGFAGQSSGFNILFLVPGLGFIAVMIAAFVLWIAWIVMLAQFLAKVSKVRARVLRDTRAADA